MASSPAVLKQLRRAWQCDCDGVSHKDTRPLSTVTKATDSMGDGIESLTGHRPRTCPWRVFYHPLVREVVQLATLAEKNLGGPAMGDDPPAVLLDALALYMRARDVTAMKDREAELKKK